MREIKFRGKIIDEGYKYGEWVKGSGIKISKSGNVIIYDEISCQWYEVDPETVGQYIGRKDRNGKEIYEKDIINFGGAINYIVIWADGFYFAFYYKSIADDEVFVLEKQGCEELEVIGNIFDNPELLPGKKY